MADQSVESFLSHKFTHLIVGGGTAGLVVATRLSENPDLTVGVIEAGSAAFDDPRINIPGRFGETLGTEHDWQFETTKQDGLDGRSLPFPRGKVLGGTSALNFMTWNRGCKEDYDAWKALGNEGWGFDDLLPYFKKTENFHQPSVEHQSQNQSLFHPDFHGTGGPLNNSYSSTYGASHQHWHKTLHKFGIKTNASHFSGSNVGVWTSLTGVTPEKRERSYSAVAYYKPNAGRSNLVLLTNAIAQEILLEQVHSEWVARGVRFSHSEEDHTVNTHGEIIICGGSVSSPQLLELSGIGNPTILSAAGVPCKIPNPHVGENLQEHMMTAMIYEISPSIITPEDLRADPILAAAADKEYALHATGPRTAIPSSVSYLPFTHFIPAEELKQMASPLLAQAKNPSSAYAAHDQIILSRLTTPQNIGQIEFNFDISNYNPYFQSVPGKKYGTMLMMLQYPFSRGSIHIPATTQQTPSHKASVADKPVIDPQYYGGAGGAIDFALMVESQHFAAKICQTAPLSDIIVKRVFPPETPPSTTTNGTGTGTNGTADLSQVSSNGHTNTTNDINGINANETAIEDLTPWVRATTITDWHPVGTCSMGPSLSAAAVVDSRLRVHGVRGLRVCDASVMPLQISAHLQATVYAIGEKGAEMIMEDWKGV